MNRSLLSALADAIGQVLQLCIIFGSRLLISAAQEGGKTSPWGRAILPPESFNQIMLGCSACYAQLRHTLLDLVKLLLSCVDFSFDTLCFGGMQIVGMVI